MQNFGRYEWHHVEVFKIYHYTKFQTHLPNTRPVNVLDNILTWMYPAWGVILCNLVTRSLLVWSGHRFLDHTITECSTTAVMEWTGYTSS